MRAGQPASWKTKSSRMPDAWLSVAADPQVIFDLAPEERLSAAMRLLGIDFASLSEEAGHA